MCKAIIAERSRAALAPRISLQIRPAPAEGLEGALHVSRLDFAIGNLRKPTAKMHHQFVFAAFTQALDEQI